MFKVQLEDMSVYVDGETAEQLKDSNYAIKYLKEVREAIEGNENKQLESLSSPKEPSVSLWKSSHPTDDDHHATLTLLSLRKALDDKFGDKKTHKNELWSQICVKMNDMGFFVGNGIEGREKVRQKFANLQAKYIKYCDARRTTGAGKIKVPKYYAELDEILGDRHKAHPVLVIDSLIKPTDTKLQAITEKMSAEGTKLQDVEPITTVTENNITAATIPQTSFSRKTDYDKPSTSGANRFTKIQKRSRPKSSQQNALQELVNIQKQNQSTRKEEFKTMLEFFQTTNNQRHEQIMALISQTQSNKKSA